MRSLTEFRSTSTAELPSDRLGRGLGLLSLGLATAQLTMPRRLLEWIGIEPSRRASAMVRLLGITKLGAGLAVLLAPRRPLPLAARAAHDLVDDPQRGLVVRWANPNAQTAHRLLT